MATIYLAIDEVTGLTLPNGEIKGLSDSEANLRTAGFDAITYTGNRLSTIDDQTAGWDDDVEPGWFRIGATVVAAIPPTDLQDLHQSIRDFQSQVVSWGENLNARSIGQPRAKVDEGHDRLFSCLGALYLIANNTAHSQTSRKLFAANLRFGAMDITKVDDFFTASTNPFPPTSAQDATIVDSGESRTRFHTPGIVSRWYTWVNITTPGVRVNLNDSVFVNGNVPTTALLLGEEWIGDINS